MSVFKGKFESARQDWTTPDDVFNLIAGEFIFTLDAAASPENSRAATFFTEDDDGIAQDWGSHTVWVNPPYGSKSGRLSDWVKKASEAAERGATVVMLIPARTNTGWFHDICMARGDVRFIRGRPKFGGAEHGLPQPLCLVVFRPRGMTS